MWLSEVFLLFRNGLVYFVVLFRVFYFFKEMVYIVKLFLSGLNSGVLVFLIYILKFLFCIIGFVFVGFGLLVLILL